MTTEPTEIDLETESGETLTMEQLEDCGFPAASTGLYGYDSARPEHNGARYEEFDHLDHPRAPLVTGTVRVGQGEVRFAVEREPGDDSGLLLVLPGEPLRRVRLDVSVQAKGGIGYRVHAVSRREYDSMSAEEKRLLWLCAEVVTASPRFDRPAPEAAAEVPS